MNDDMNTPKLLGEIFQVIKNTTSLNEEQTIKIKQTVKYVFEVLGFQLKSSKKDIIEDKLLSEFFEKYGIEFSDIESAMTEFIKVREDLRSEKKYAEADIMREDLLQIGLVINDGENVGWYWKNS